MKFTLYYEEYGYDLTKRSGLNFGKERRTLLQSFVPKGKAPDYYHKDWAMCPPLSSNFEYKESLYHDRLSGTSSWESDDSVGAIFENLSVNMISTSHLEDEEMIQSDTDP